MDAQRPTPAFCQYLEVAACLGRFHYAECVLLLGNGQIDGIITGDLQKHPRIWAAFVSLSGGMQEPRSETKTSSNTVFVANAMSHHLQLVLVVLIHLDVRQQREVIATSDAVEVSAKVSRKRLLGRLAKRLGVLAIGEQLHPILFEKGFLGRER